MREVFNMKSSVRIQAIENLGDCVREMLVSVNVAEFLKFAFPAEGKRT